MIDSQPSASQPRNSRVPARRQTVHRPKPVSRQVLGSGARWKVQLELAPAEIALVYRQGLAHGAEVRRHGTQEWRPLVTTPELRAALAASKQLSAPLSARPVRAATATQPPPIADRALATLLSGQHGASANESLAPLPTFALPPPPPVLSTRVGGAGANSSRERRDLVPDSAVTQPMARRAVSGPPLDLPALAFTPAGSPSAAHARPVELSFVAVAAVAMTLVVMLLVQRAAHWGEVRAHVAAASELAQAELDHGKAGLAEPIPASALPASDASNARVFGSIPVVTVHQLPVEKGLLSAPRSGPAVAGTPDRVAFARAMAGAASSARNCGAGPVQTRVVATFAPSGVPRSVHFASTPPSAALRSCVLSAVARARVSPFVGEPVTVSKNLSW